MSQFSKRLRYGKIYVFNLPDSAYSEGYAVRWPLHAGRFNTWDYTSHQNILSDIEEIWRTTIQNKLKIEPSAFNVSYRNMRSGVALIILVGILCSFGHPRYLGQILCS